MEKVGLLLRLVAKPGKESELEGFLKSALPLAQAEPNTISFYVIKINASTFGVFDTFPSAEARNAHLNGPIAAALGQKAGELLATAPSIEPIDLLAVK